MPSKKDYLPGSRPQSFLHISESSSSNPLLEFILDGGVGDKKPQPPLQPPHYSSAFSSLRFSSSATESSEKPTKRSKEDESALQLSLLLNPLLRICSKTPFGKEESEELRAILGVKDGTNNKLIGCDNKQIHATGPNGRTAMHFLISGELKKKTLFVKEYRKLFFIFAKCKSMSSR